MTLAVMMNFRLTKEQLGLKEIYYYTSCCIKSTVLRIRTIESECLTITDIRSRCLRWMLGLINVTGDEQSVTSVNGCQDPLIHKKGNHTGPLLVNQRQKWYLLVLTESCPS